MEKEHKILNPHRMQMKTTNREEFKDFKVMPKLQLPNPYEPDNLEFPVASTYRQDFQNWKAGPNYIERHPQYPVYSLPFTGESEYRAANQKMVEEQKGWKHQDAKEINKKMYSSAGRDIGIRNAIYAPRPFKHNSINRQDFKPFVIDPSRVRKNKEEAL